LKRIFVEGSTRKKDWKVSRFKDFSTKNTQSQKGLNLPSSLMYMFLSSKIENSASASQLIFTVLQLIVKQVKFSLFQAIKTHIIRSHYCSIMYCTLKLKSNSFKLISFSFFPPKQFNLLYTSRRLVCGNHHCCKYGMYNISINHWLNIIKLQNLKTYYCFIQ
jgi:hypothetical protein